MSTSTITAGVDHLHRVLGTAVSWAPHAAGADTGPAGLDLPLALAAGLPVPAPRAPEVPATRPGRGAGGPGGTGTRRPAGRRRATAMRR
jgi:hypothetical protein